MKNFLQMSNFDPAILLGEVLRQPDLWKADTYLRDYPQGPFGDTETIFLRFPPASVTELERGARDPHECVWMDGWLHLPAARGLVHSLVTRTSAERIGRVMINKLKPGGRIYAHADTPEHAQYWDRYHLVLQSSPGCNFRCGDEQVWMPPGTAWWFQNALEHEVLNNGSVDRIHLVVDLRTEHLSAQGLTPTSSP